MKQKTENAVSPVIGVMLMLIVVLIIAAVVSAFAGGTIGGVKKVPQATIAGKFSISTGLEITHSGGDGLATTDLVFLIRDGPMFGQNLEQKTAQVLNKTQIANKDGLYMIDSTGNVGFSSFMSGDVLYIDSTNSTCANLQPGVSGSSSYCISNIDNVGKVFSLEVSDSKGNLISKSDVTVSS